MYHRNVKVMTSMVTNLLEVAGGDHVFPFSAAVLSPLAMPYRKYSEGAGGVVHARLFGERWPSRLGHERYVRIVEKVCTRSPTLCFPCWCDVPCGMGCPMCPKIISTCPWSWSGNMREGYLAPRPAFTTCRTWVHFFMPDLLVYR